MAAFTSDLSIPGFALGARLGLEPLRMVMGSSIFQVGWQATPLWTGGTQELGAVSEAWNECRRLALARLAEEAGACGADAVVGVSVSQRHEHWAEATVEMNVIGTAVRVPGAERRPAPALTSFPVEDYWKLTQAGFRPVGIVGATSVDYVAASWRTQQLTSGWVQPNAELTDFTQGVYAARELALGRLTTQARELGAGGVIGVRIEQSARTVAVSAGGRERHDLIATFHVLGTAIAAGEGAPSAPDLVVHQGTGGA